MARQRAMERWLGTPRACAALVAAAVGGAAAGGAVGGAAGAAVGVGAVCEHPATATTVAASTSRPHLIRCRFKCVTSFLGCMRDRSTRRCAHPHLTRGRGLGVG